MEEEKIKKLKQFFAVTVAAFEMQHSISKAFGYLGGESYMHQLHLSAKEEVNKEKPNFSKIYLLLEMMEEEAENNAN